MNPAIPFWTGALGLALLAWLMLIVPTRRTSSRAGERQRLNLQLRRDQVTALDLELVVGDIAREEYRQAMAEVELAVLEEDAQAPIPGPSAKARKGGSAVPRRMSAALALGIAAAAFGMYGFLGNMDGLHATATVRGGDDANSAEAEKGTDTTRAGLSASGPDAATASVEAMLDSMAERMARQREGTVDATGWSLVARSYAAMQRFDSASRAYARALALAPDDAQLLADQSDVLSMLQQRRMGGEPIRLALRALEIDPNNLKALALAGTDAFERRDLIAALNYWGRAQKLSPPGEFALGIDRSLAAVQDALERSQAWPAEGGSSKAAATGAAQLRLRGRLSVAPELAGRVSPTDTVFVFVREVGAAGIPIATARYSANDLPVDFTLDNNSAMVDTKRLSSSSRLEIGARISSSGDATARSGELRGKSGPVAIDRQDIAITIDHETP